MPTRRLRLQRPQHLPLRRRSRRLSAGLLVRSAGATRRGGYGRATGSRRPDYLFDALVAQLAQHPPQSGLIVTIRIAILVLCVGRIVNRFINPPPDLPGTARPLQRVAAKASHILLCGLMLVTPPVRPA